MEKVTSLAEVWIETIECMNIGLSILSLPLRKCGLKHSKRDGRCAVSGSLPLRKCGLKLSIPLMLLVMLASLPLRKCGLKHVCLFVSYH